MKLPCELIQDLLPLYHDQVCSPASREAVEVHLQNCPACQRVLDAMGEDLLTPAEIEEEKELRPLAEWWQKQKKKSHLNTIVYTMFLVIILGLGWYFATWYVDITIPADKMENNRRGSSLWQSSPPCGSPLLDLHHNSNMELWCSFIVPLT